MFVLFPCRPVIRDENGGENGRNYLQVFYCFNRQFIKRLNLKVLQH